MHALGARLRRLSRIALNAGPIHAAHYVRRAIASRWANRGRPRSRYVRQWNQIREGDCEAAIAALEAAFRSCPFDLECYFVLGAAHHARGDIVEAVAVWGRGAEMQAQLVERAGQCPETRYLGPLFTSSIGHMALCDVFAKRRILGLTKETHFLFPNPRTLGNAAYLDLWRSHFGVIDRFDNRRLSEISLAQTQPTVLWLNDRWHWIHDAASLIEDAWQAQARGPLLALTEEHKDRARRVLEARGLPRDAWFVTLHVREASSWPDDGRSRRDAKIADYIPAMQNITRHGGHVIRIGNPLMPKLPDMPGVIDYAHGPREDWLDLYLIAAPRFFIGTNSGPVWAAGTFGNCALLTNWAPAGIRSHYKNTVTLHQRLWSKTHGRLLTPEEQMAGPWAWLEAAHLLDKHGLVAVRNSPQEIAEACDMLLSSTASSARASISAPSG